MPMHECEMWLLCDHEGNYVVAKDAGDLAEAYDQEVGSDAGYNRRTVKVTIAVQVEECVSLVGSAPPEGEAKLSVA